MGPLAPPGPRVIAAPVIAIDGIDGSGKSTFAQELAAGLARAGWPAALFSVDDFRRPVDWARADRREVDTYYDDYYDLPMLEACLQAFQAGAPRVTIPVFDSRTEGLAGERDVELAGAAVAVVEGVFVLRVPSAAAAGLGIYIDVDGVEAGRRLLERDLARGRPRAVIEHRLAERYQPAQERYVAAYEPARRADVVIDGNTPYRFRSMRRDVGRLPSALSAALAPLLPPALDPFSP